MQCEDQALLAYKVPKLLIQPIIENAVFHGIEPDGEDGAITIRIENQPEDYIIRIANSGRKIDFEKIQPLSEKSRSTRNHISACRM